MVNDHAPIAITSFRGRFDRGEDDSIPNGFFLDSKNNRFLQSGAKTREGSSSLHTIPSVRRAAIYKIPGEAQRLLILDDSNQLFDSTNLASPILTVSGMTDFSMETIYGRAYITPHNGVTGLPGEKVYVYSGSGTARAAAGVTPTSVTLAVTDSALSGNCEEGEKVIAVCYLTSTGYITAPAGYLIYDPVGGKRLDVAGLPIGGTGVSGRVLLSTKTLVDFNGDFLHQTYYFIPGGTINDNSSTDLNDTLSFFDADLEDDASYLLEQLDTIPAGVGIGLFNGHMIVWGEDANPSTCRVSLAGQPESMNGADGFITVNPGDAGTGLKNCWGFRKQLNLEKAQASYFTSDNGNVAATWEVPEAFDASIGTTPHGVGKVLDYGEMVQDYSIIAHTTGLRLFNGTFDDKPLTFAISDLWGSISKTNFHKVEVAIDAHNFCLYACVPLNDASECSHIIYGDYSQGLDFENIRWDVWEFPRAPQTVVVDIDSSSNKSVMKFGSLAGNVYKMDTTATSDFGTAIDAYIEFGYLPITDDDAVRSFVGTRVRVFGSGSLNVTAHGLDSIETCGPYTITLSATPGHPIFQGMNLVSERCAVKFRTVGINDRYTITKMSLMTADIWEQRANG